MQSTRCNRVLLKLLRKLCEVVFNSLRLSVKSLDKQTCTQAGEQTRKEVTVLPPEQGTKS